MTAPALERGIGRVALTALVVNCVVGAGVLGLPGRGYAVAGEWLFAVLAAAGLLAFAVALCLAELSSRFDRTGGPVLYLAAAFGPAAGFAAGWLSWVSTVMACASLLNLFASYAGAFAGIGVRSHGAIIAITVAAMTLLAVSGIRASARASTALVAGKIALLVAIAALGLTLAEAVPDQPRPASPDPTAALVLLFFAFVGFERPTALAGEVIQPRRAMPVALGLGMLLVAALYAAVFAACMRAVPGLAGAERPVAEIALRSLGPGGQAVMDIGALVILGGTIATQFITAPRLLLALGEARQLPAPLALVHPRRRTPHVAILASAAVSLILALTGDFIGSLTAASAARLTVFAACALALVRLRRAADAPPAAFLLPAGVPLAILTAIACAVFLALGDVKELPRLLGLAAIGAVLALGTRVLRPGSSPSRGGGGPKG